MTNLTFAIEAARPMKTKDFENTPRQVAALKLLEAAKDLMRAANTERVESETGFKHKQEVMWRGKRAVIDHEIRDTSTMTWFSSSGYIILYKKDGTLFENRRYVNFADCKPV